MMKTGTETFPGKEHSDERGTLIAFNDFSMSEIVRMYTIVHHDTDVLRAWQGHQRECKWFYVVEGAFTALLVKPDNWENPSPNLQPEKYILKAKENTILKIPGGYINGIKALEPFSKIVIFSDFTMAESAADSFRFDKQLWNQWHD